MKYFKKAISMLLACTVFMSSSFSAFAETNTIEKKTEEELKQVVRGSDEDVAAAPNGRFDFLSTQMTTSEDIKSAEITILRKGGTEGPATVTLKAIDISAKYGKDYVIKAPAGGISEKTIPKNSDAPPLIESFGEENSDIAVSFAEEQNDKAVDEEELVDEEEPINEEASVDREESGDEEIPDKVLDETIDEKDEFVDEEEVLDDVSKQPTEELKLKEIEVKNTQSVQTIGLAKAYQNSVGRKAKKSDWRLSTPKESQKAKEANDQFLKEVEGITYDLKFADGEYMKKLYFCTIDDDISESDEQVVLTLQNPTTGVLGDLNTAYINIKDNDEFEKPEFALKDKTIYVSEKDSVARVTLVRTAGLYQYASLIAATADITAKENVDYAATSKELIFVPGVASQTVEIPLIKNAGGEGGDKAFALMFGEKTRGGFNEELTTLIVIKDNEDEGILAPEQPQATFLNQENGADRPEKEIPASENMMLFNAPAAVTATATEKIVSIPRGQFKKHPFLNLGTYMFYPDPDNTVTPYYPQSIYVNGGGSIGTTYVPVELFGVDKITWSWMDNANVSPDNIMGLIKYSQLIGNTIFFASHTPKRTVTGKFLLSNDSYNLTSEEKFNSNNKGVYFQTKIYDKTGISWLYVYDVELHYNKYNIVFGDNSNKDDADAWIQPMKFTGTKTSVPDGDKIYVGSLKVKDETKGFFGDTITFEPVYNSLIDQNKVYLWGFKLENAKGEYLKRIEGNTLTLDEATLRKLADDKMLLNNLDTIKVKPIFKQRTHSVQVIFDKSVGGVSGFNSEDNMTLQAYDTLSLGGYAQAPKYAAGYSAVGYNNNEVTNFDPYPYRPFDISSQINPANPGKIEKYRPSHDREVLTLLYSDPELNLKYHPGEKDPNELGEVYVSLEDQGEKGGFDKPIRISPLIMDQTYRIMGVPADGYLVSWRDFTGDTDGDGVLSAAEKLAMGDSQTISQTIRGNTFYYRPIFPISNIYYTFEPKNPSAKERTIQGSVFLKGGTVLNKEGGETPIEGAAVTVGNDTVYTDSDGEFSSRSTDYDLTGLYSLKINYQGYDFISRAEVSAWGKHVINAFDVLVPEDFKIYKTLTGKSENMIKPDEVDNGTADYRFTFRTSSKEPGVKAAQATIRVYAKDGQFLRKKYEIASNSQDFELKMTPADDGILPGDYMTLQLTDQNGKTYFENKVGFSFIRSLDTQTFDFIQSFHTPITPVLDLFGKVKLVSSIGLAGQVSDYFTRSDNQLTMNFGFSKDYKHVKETIKISDVKESADSSEKQKEKTDSAVAKDGDEKNTKKSSVTTNISFNVECGISVVMELDTDESSEYYNEFYFKQMVLMGSLGASYGKKYEYMTPLGVPVFITWDLAGVVSVAYAYEQYDNKKFYFNDEKPIDLTKSGTNNTNRDFTMIGRYYIEPSITLGAGVGYSLLNISLNGCAALGLNFTTIGEGSGDITLSAYLKLKLLLFTKSWSLGSTSFPLFSYGTMGYSVLDSEDYRYDDIDTLEQMPRDYLMNRGLWKGSEKKHRLLAASDDIAEGELLSGSYPYPETKMVKYGDKVLMVFIDDDGSRTQENRTILKYSIFNGADWSEPIPICDDGTLDCEPNLFDLGDKILLTWSNSSQVLPTGANVIESLSSLDISSAFFDKGTGKFGDVSQITKTTKEDVAADNMPTVAYDEATKKLVLYYTKTEYDAPTLENGGENEETDTLIGDVLNGFSLISYTFYDDINGWKSSYTDEEKATIMANANPSMTEEEFKEYEENWYGQQFLDLAPQIKIDESGILNNGVYWQEGKTPTITAFLNENAKVMESTAISYNQLSLFAYVMDGDGDRETFDDQDIYLQIYDFKDNIFTHPIQITNDDKKDSNIRLIRNDGETYLYFISGGDIKYTNISSIVKTGLSRESVDGREFYILNKSIDSGYDGTITVVTQKEGNPLSEFEVKTDDAQNIYLVWPEILTTYKEGVDQSSEAATLPENQYRETQIFIARYTYAPETLLRKVYDGDGNEFEIREETVTIGNWSMPVQYTHEKGANLTELDFVIMDDGTLKTVYNKSYSMVSDANHITNDENNTTLTTADFVPRSQVLISSDDITFIGELVQAGSQDYIGAKITNDGLETLKGYKVKIYQGQNDVKTLLSESSLDDYGNMGFPGGKAAYVGTPWQVPESLEGLYIEIVVEDAEGFFVAAVQKSVQSKAVLELSDLEAQLTDVDTATVAVTVTNTGNIAAKEESLYINAGDENVGLSEFNLAAGESKRINMNVNLSGKFTSVTDEKGNIRERVQIEGKTRDASLDTTVERTATAKDIELMKLLSDISFKKQKLSINKGSEDALLIEAQETYNIGGETRTFDSLFDIIWKSSDENVAKVFNDGSVVAVNKGSATISAYIMPKCNTYYATNLTNPVYITELERKAGALVKHLEAEILVDIPTGKSNNDGKKSDPEKPETNIPVPSNIFADKKLITKTYTPQEGDDIDCLVMADKDGNIIPYSYYDAETGLMNAWVDEPLADYQIRSVKIDFTDVSGMWHEKAVQYLAARNIITGISENSFGPDKNIKRADFVLLLVRLMGLKGNTVDSFDDVDPGSYYANAVSVAKQNGIILGSGEGSFYPEREISRQDMFTIAHRVLTMMGIKSGSGSLPSYTDAKDIAEYAKVSVDYLSKLKLIKGYDGAINPSLSSKRSETAQFIYNIFKCIVEK